MEKEAITEEACNSAFLPYFYLHNYFIRVMKTSIHYVTQESLRKMQEDLNVLKTAGRTNIAKAIAEAREKGDLKENAEYDAAKEAQGLHEAKIIQLETAIANARIINTNSIDTSKVSVLTKVTILNMTNGKEFTYQIVSEQEANVKLNKISVRSPIAQGLLGKKIGESALIATPASTLQFKILGINR